MDDTTRALLDRVELDEVMNRYAAAIDLRDWAREGGSRTSRSRGTSRCGNLGILAQGVSPGCAVLDRLSFPALHSARRFAQWPGPRETLREVSRVPSESRGGGAGS
jgi:hypothetical protein